MAETLPDQHLLDEYYTDGAPAVIKVGFKYGYGPAIVELNKKVYFHPDPLIDPIMREAIQAICLSNCRNNYCTVMHTRGLLLEGFSMAEVKLLIQQQSLPQWVANREVWETTLKRLSAIFKNPAFAPGAYNSLSEFHGAREIDDIGGIVAFALLHKLLLELYADEILIHQEPILFGTIDCADELIRFIEAEAARSDPMYTICCICKDIKCNGDWLPVESAIGKFPADGRISHGMCPGCVTRWTKNRSISAQYT